MDGSMIALHLNTTYEDVKNGVQILGEGKEHVQDPGRAPTCYVPLSVEVAEEESNKE